MEVGPALIGDIGGTNARFALVTEDGEICHKAVLATRDYANLEPALVSFVRDAGVTTPLRAAAVCAAGPLYHGQIRLSNSPWVVSEDVIRRATGAAPLLLNDFTALALSIPVLQVEDVRALGGGQADPNSAVAVLGPGTGLGVSGALPTGGGDWVAISGEGGHVSLAAASKREWDVLSALIERFGHASAERVLSGSGIETLYAVLCGLEGTVPDPIDASRISERGLRRECGICREVVALFTAWLGSTAGDLTLTLGARGGVYIAGGIIPQWGDAFDRDLFRKRFEAKGRFAAYLSPIPTYLITAKYPVFAGLAAAVTGPSRELHSE